MDSATVTDPAADVAADLVRRLADPATADPAYDALPGTGGGRVLNADAARGLSPHYATVADRLAFTACTDGPSTRYVTDRLLRTIAARTAHRDDTPSVLFVAGGPASGKTAAAAALLDREAADLIVDAGLPDADAATRLFNGALRSGWAVSVLYVHRPFSYALADMLDRAWRFGRFVPLRPDADRPDLALAHLRAQRAIVTLAQRFAATAAVTVAVARNGASRRHPDHVHRIDVADLGPGGGYHYGSLDALRADQARALDDFAADERVPEPVRAAIAGGRPADRSGLA